MTISQKLSNFMNTHSFHSDTKPQKHQPSALVMTTSHAHTARVRAIAALTLAFFLVAPGMRAADSNPPEKMTYQGYLVDANGAVLGSGTPKNYDIQFRIYDAAQGTTNKVWSEQQTVTVDNGNFSVLLGEGAQIGSEPHNAISGAFTGGSASDRFIGITVLGLAGGNVEILPRLRLLPSPYAFMAKNANAVANSTGTQVITLSGTQVGINKAVPGSALDVTGTVTATAFSGSGANVTSISAANISSGSLADGRLSANVVLLNGGQTFSTAPTFGSGIFIGDTIQSTGGNTRGVDSTDLQTVRGVATQVASGNNSGIIGGRNHTASGLRATVAGGDQNSAIGPDSFVGGGNFHTASGSGASAIVGGNTGTASGLNSFIGGGNNNTASGDNSAVLGGANNVAAGQWSVAMGRRAKANFDGSMVLADSQNSDIASAAVNQLSLRFQNGVRLNDLPMFFRTGVDVNHGLGWTNSFGGFSFDGPALWGYSGGVLGTRNGGDKGVLRWNNSGYVGINQGSPASPLHVKQTADGSVNGGIKLEKADGASTWRIYVYTDNDLVFDASSGPAFFYIRDQDGYTAISSDRRLKKDILPMDSMLDKVMALKPVTFRYKKNDSSKPVSFGFIAQDVEEVLPELVDVKKDIKHINYGALLPITIEAIQGLNKKLDETVKQKDAEIQAMRTEMQELRKMVEGLAKQIAE
jgi:hypothetical protein